MIDAVRKYYEKQERPDNIVPDVNGGYESRYRPLTDEERAQISAVMVASEGSLGDTITND